MLVGLKIKILKMSNKSNIIIGIVAILTPFSGFPRDIKTAVFVLIGLALVIYSLKSVRLENKKKDNYFRKEKHKDVFMESKPSKIASKNIQHKFTSGLKSISSEDISDMEVATINASSHIADNE